MSNAEFEFELSVDRKRIRLRAAHAKFTLYATIVLVAAANYTQMGHDQIDHLSQLVGGVAPILVNLAAVCVGHLLLDRIGYLVMSARLRSIERQVAVHNGHTAIQTDHGALDDFESSARIIPTKEETAELLREAATKQRWRTQRVAWPKLKRMLRRRRGAPVTSAFQTTCHSSGIGMAIKVHSLQRGLSSSNTSNFAESPIRFKLRQSSQGIRSNPMTEIYPSESPKPSR